MHSPAPVAGTAQRGTTLCTMSGFVWQLQPVGDQSLRSLLLRARPTVGVRNEDGSEIKSSERGPEARRPADIYVPRWDLGGSAALDFAVTSGLRTDLLQGTVSDASSCLTSYEHFKNLFMDTASLCASEGISFVPMVVEAHSGAWGPSARFG